MTPRRIALFLAALLMPIGVLCAAETFDSMRGKTPIPEEPPAPFIAPERDSTLREVRNYPEQPPVIPHKSEDYTIDLRSNKCLSCHARARTGESQAPMVSITHFMDRDGQFRAAVTPRRYFCTQCHVPQHEVKELVKNGFIDADSMLAPTTDNK
jgi:nitrate reductase (cytochrome), electron transfer subunit